ncbi:glycosyltransferase, partial [Acidimicrobiaceae bacterium USS-CC1]|nr:glycosyltransferase [Acidiferrimicrobium australe]
MLAFSPLDAYSGMGARTRAVIEDLVALGAEVVPISVGEGDDGATLRAGSATLRVEAVTVGSKGGLLPRLGWRLRQLAPSLDALVMEGAMFVPAVTAAGARCPLVWDVNELETLHYRRLPPAPATTARRAAWRILEEWAARQAAVVVAISDDEADWCSRLLPASRDRLAVVGHRVPRPPSISISQPTRTRRPDWGETDPRIVFVGNLGAKHNADAARWIVEALAPELQCAATVLLVGPGTETAGSGRIGRAHVVGLGAVEDLSTVIGSDDIAIAPLAAGAGVKTKVLDYLDLGCRVVATPVSLEGIADPPGVVRAELDGFAGALRAMVSSPEPVALLRRRGEQQRAWLGRHAAPAGTQAGWRDVLARLGLA